MDWGRCLIGAMAMTVASCSAVQDTGAAEQAAGNFHAAYNAGQFDQIYADATEEITRGTTREAFTATMTEMKARLGNQREASRTGLNVNYNTAGSFVSLGYDTQFERGRAAEELTFRMVDGRARLAGYRFNIMGVDGGESNAAAPADGNEAAPAEAGN